MKRLAWLLILAVGTALAQVSPVEPLVTRQTTCSCCAHPNECGMPGCIPTATPSVVPMSPAIPARNALAKLRAPAPRGLREEYYVQFQPRVRTTPVFPAGLAGNFGAGVPLFREHCSLLI